MHKKILVIEDDPIATRLIEYTLGQVGYQVLTAESGPEGLKTAQRERPDLIVLNVMLPGIDGFEVCQRLRAEPQTADLPIVLLSGKARQIDIATGFKMGANEYLTKPADPSEITSTVQRLLARKTSANCKIVTFLGSRSGVGTTTIVVNLAIALSQWDKWVIAVDLCPGDGSIAERLGIKPQDTITHLLQKPLDSMDRRDLESALMVHHTGVKVLNIPQPSGDQEIVSPSNIDLLFDKLGEVTDYFLVDLPFQPNVATRALLVKSDLTIIVSDYTTDALKGVKSALTLLRLAGISKERVGVVTVDREGTFPEWELAKIKPFVEPNIGVGLLGIIPYAPEVSLAPASDSNLVTLHNTNCPMACSINVLAQDIIAGKINNKDFSRTEVRKAWTETNQR